MVVNEKSSLRELTIAVLMTHWDYISPVFFFRKSNLTSSKIFKDPRGNALMASKKWANAIEDFKTALHRG